MASTSIGSPRSRTSPGASSQATRREQQGDDKEELTGRVSDLVGLVTFAGFADAITPPTLDHAFVLAQLNHQEIVSRRDEDGTAIGDAISLAVEKLNTLDRSEAREKVKSKVLILLTDGENNAGEIDPVQAAELAKKMGVKIYTIGVGTRGSAPVPVRNPFTGQQDIQWVEVNIDEDTLHQDRRRRPAASTSARPTPSRSPRSTTRSISSRRRASKRGTLSTIASWRFSRSHVGAWSVAAAGAVGAGAACGAGGAE